ncbi:MAG: AarF/ABC1/UbiB kinase family protein, partial [Desulfoferrobacter sp.]
GYMKMMPKYFHDILRQTAGGKQRIELWHGGFEQLNAHFEKGVNRLTVGLVIAASIIAAALILNSSQKVLQFSFNFLGAQNVSITALLGIVGYTIATILGIWLIVSILRSGKL